MRDVVLLGLVAALIAPVAAANAQTAGAGAPTEITTTEDAVSDVGLAGAPEAAGPPLWRVSDEDSTVYLFGSLIAAGDVEGWLTDDLAGAMTGATVTVLETDLAAVKRDDAFERLIADRGLQRDGGDLPSEIGRTRWTRFSEIAESVGFDPTRLVKQRPWLAAMTIALAKLEAGAANLAAAPDQLLARAAKDEGDAFKYLETIDAQIIRLAELDGAAALGNFDASLAELEDYDAFLAATGEAWRRGDADRLASLFHGPLKSISEDAYRALIVRVAAEWTLAIADYLDTDEDHIVIVGASYLVGPDGVAAQLEQLGYPIDRVN